MEERMGEESMKKAVTFSIDNKIADTFQTYCQLAGLNMSRQVEMFMEKQLKWSKAKGER
jgi:antitoxin component of RelBE/YafQ-DinJ toxin-antitoxin module